MFGYNLLHREVLGKLLNKDIENNNVKNVLYIVNTLLLGVRKDIIFEHIFNFECSLNKNLNIVKAFIHHHKDINIHANNEMIFINACATGNIEYAKWLLSLEQTHGKIYIGSFCESAFRLACNHGHIEMAKFLISLSNVGYHKIDIHASNDGAFEYAICHDDINVINFILSLDKIKIRDILFSRACEHGCFDSIKILLNLDLNYWDAPPNYNKLFEYSCIQKNIEIAKYVWNFCKSSIILDSNDITLFTKIYETDNDDIIEWIWDLYKKETGQKINFDYKNNLLTILEHICLREHTPSFNKFYNLYRRETGKYIDLSSNNYELFKKIIETGNTSTDEWFWERYHEKTGKRIDLDFNNYEIFRHACFTSNYRYSVMHTMNFSVTWVWDKYYKENGKYIDLTVNNYEIFRCACYRGNIYVADFVCTKSKPNFIKNEHVLWMKQNNYDEKSISNFIKIFSYLENKKII